VHTTLGDGGVDLALVNALVLERVAASKDLGVGSSRAELFDNVPSSGALVGGSVSANLPGFIDGFFPKDRENL